MKFLKTIRFDPSDSQVFELAAEPDEWAIPGAFVFSRVAEPDLTGKRKQAFSNGFLSLETFGHATFTSVADVTESDVERLKAALADHFVNFWGAPSFEMAEAAAAEEIDFVLELCAEVPVNSVFTLRRFFDEQGAIKEEFRIVDPSREKLHARIWEITDA